MPGILELIAGVSAVAALFAWLEWRRMRSVQERDFNFQRSADVRLDQFQYFAHRDLPEARAPRDELRFRVKNVGRAFAAEMTFAVDNRGLLTYVQMGLGLPPNVHRELTVVLTPDPALGPRKVLLRYRYHDYRRHWGEVQLLVPDGSHRHYGQYRGPQIFSARLDRAPNPAIAESDVFETPMRQPRWYDGVRAILGGVQDGGDTDDVAWIAAGRSAHLHYVASHHWSHPEIAAVLGLHLRQLRSEVERVVDDFRDLVDHRRQQNQGRALRLLYLLGAADGGVAIEDMPALLDSLIKRASGVAPVRCPA